MTLEDRDEGERVEAGLSPYIARFQYLIDHSVIVARTRIEKNNLTGTLTNMERERALNILSYALKRGEIWGEAYKLLLLLVPRMEMVGLWGEWILLLQQALLVAQEQQDHSAEAELSLALGHIYRLQGKFRQACDLLWTSVNIYVMLDEKNGQARAFNQLAYAAWQQHKYDEAGSLAQSALEKLPESNPERAMSFSALGLVAFDRGDWYTAENYHRMAMSIRQSNNDQMRAAWSLQNLGDVLRSQGDYPTAISCFEESISMLTNIGDRSHLGIVQMNLGIVYDLCGETTKALEQYTQAEKAFRQVTDQFNLAKVLTNQGLSYLSLHKWQVAANLFTISAELFYELGDRSWYLNALDGAGIAYLEQGAYEKALAAFKTVAAQLPEIANTPAHRVLLPKIADQLRRATLGN